MATAPVTNSSSSVYDALNGSPTTKTDDGSERFLKLLVTQMKNQDPMNPMDNAQVTSQIAQINTVTGISTLNQTVKSLSSQMLSSQVLQGAGLVGHTVLMEGSKLHFGEDGKTAGGFELANAADSVKVEILSPSGRVVDTINIGAASAGRSGFEWAAPTGTSTDGMTFRVTAKSGSTTLTATPLTTDLVKAVSTSGDTLNLELLFGGSIPYTQVKAIS
ncbi:flagellar hook assembly protein FlgD [Methylibium petroleiphilum]|uniref:flagellar hook assembly protein FlgD n=1 Tax=Methylibium petroleiphilum TaxID=105560 RepID=UPI001AD45572|nr:flagellar hook capping FlgD N-terminal domain-containing protein [Methylibium petroleiphilum]MBN9204690.1 flagellar hook assembly protein FlgD [Methylibium petroleiphilum]